jgi:hypothetical protein
MATVLQTAGVCFIPGAVAIGGLLGVDGVRSSTAWSGGRCPTHGGERVRRAAAVGTGEQQRQRTLLIGRRTTALALHQREPSGARQRKATTASGPVREEIR